MRMCEDVLEDTHSDVSSVFTTVVSIGCVIIVIALFRESVCLMQDTVSRTTSLIPQQQHLFDGVDVDVFPSLSHLGLHS